MPHTPNNVRAFVEEAAKAVLEDSKHILTWLRRGGTIIPPKEYTLDEKFLYLVFSYFVRGYSYNGALQKAAEQIVKQGIVDEETAYELLRKYSNKYYYIYQYPELKEYSQKSKETVFRTVGEFTNIADHLNIISYKYNIPSKSLLNLKENLYTSSGRKLKKEDWEKYLRLYRAIKNGKIEKVLESAKATYTTAKPRQAWSPNKLKEVAEMLLEGKNWNEIAARYGISPHSLYQHVFLRYMKKFREAATAEVNKMFDFYKRKIKEKGDKEILHLSQIPFHRFYNILSNKHPKTFSPTVYPYIEGFRRLVDALPEDEKHDVYLEFPILLRRELSDTLFE